MIKAALFLYVPDEKGRQDLCVCVEPGTLSPSPVEMTVCDDHLEIAQGGAVVGVVKLKGTEVVRRLRTFSKAFVAELAQDGDISEARPVEWRRSPKSAGGPVKHHVG